MAPRTCLIATVKDEAPWILEWVAHHRAIGFDKIVVASNDCTDGSDLILDRLQELSLLRHFRNRPPWRDGRIQLTAYQRARRYPEVATARWVMALDLDEYLNIKVGQGGIQDLIATIPNRVRAVAVTWRVFGDAGLEGWVGTPLTRSFTRAASAETNVNSVKVLFRDHVEFALFGAHGPRAETDAPPEAAFEAVFKTVGGHGLGPFTLTRPGMNFYEVRPEHQCWDIAQVNHYMTKTRDMFTGKRRRGQPFTWYDIDAHYTQEMFERHNRNEVEDLSIARTDAARMDLLDRLLADPLLGRLHHAAQDQHRRQIAEPPPAPPSGPSPEPDKARADAAPAHPARRSGPRHLLRRFF